jgi:hypothetical protein
MANRDETERQRREEERIRQLDAARVRQQDAFLKVSRSLIQEQSWRLTNAIRAAMLREPGENTVIIIDRNVPAGVSYSFGESKKWGKQWEGWVE